MSNLEQLLLVEYDALQEKMYMCKTIYVRYNMNSKHSKFLRQQAVLSIYAAWEGFVKNSISLYLQAINKERVKCRDLHENYISYQADQIIAFHQAKTKFPTIKKITRELYEVFQKEARFNTQVNTKSNANLGITNSILEKLALPKLPKKFERKLNKLLLFRNSVAHGSDDGIVVSQDDVNDFSILVQELSSEIIERLIDGFCKKIYLRDC